MPSATDRNLDLFALVADKDMEFALKGILGRPERLGIRSIRHQVAVHPQHDPGVRKRCAEFLRPLAGFADHTLVMLDREGSGDDTRREDIETNIENRLAANGWEKRSAAIVVDPELEIWTWSDSPEVPQALGWTTGFPDFKEWLVSEGHLRPGDVKPHRPKEAVHAVLRHTRKRRSSSIFHQIAANVSFQRCTDPAFEKFRSVLQGWFPS